MIDQKTAQKLKEKGVDPSIILDLMLDQEAAPEQKPETDPILAAINKLTGAIQASNILKSGTDGPQNETADDILAQMINPKGGK